MQPNISYSVSFGDGLVNALTGTGTTRDPRSFNRYCHNRVSDIEIDAAYRSSWMVRRIVEKPAGEMVREWRDWQAEAPDIEKLEAEEKRLGIREKVKRALVLAGLGGGALVLHTADTDPSKPLNPATISQGGLRAVHVWHKSRFTLGEMISDPLDDWHGHPSFYEMTGAASVKLHPSRVIAFPGQTVPDIMGSSWEERWWGDSVVASVLDAVANVDTAENGFAALVKDARNRRVFIPNLFNLVTTAGGEQQLAKRMQSFAIGESMYGISFLDGGGGDGKGGERIEDRQMVWSGIPEMKASFLAAVAAAADMPATVLLGKSPDGMNATGAGDLTVWENTVKTRQDMDLRPRLDRLDAVLIPSAGVTAPKVWYSFAPLSTPTEAVEATTFKTWTEAVAAVQTSGAIPEVALNKAVQNTLTERGWLVGLDAALAEIPEAERFGMDEMPDDDSDPSALTQAMNAGGGRKAAPPFRDSRARRGVGGGGGSYNPTQPRGANGRWIPGRVRAVIDEAARGASSARAVELGKVGAGARRNLAALGLSGDRKNVVVAGGVARHIFNRHGNERRASHADVSGGHIAAAASFLNNASRIRAARAGQDGNPRVVSATRVRGQTVFAVFSHSKKSLSLVTMWIRE